MKLSFDAGLREYILREKEKREGGRQGGRERGGERQRQRETERKDTLIKVPLMRPKSEEQHCVVIPLCHRNSHIKGLHLTVCGHHNPKGS